MYWAACLSKLILRDIGVGSFALMELIFCALVDLQYNCYHLML